MSRSALSLCALCFVQLAQGHHSSIGIYGEENLIDIEGVVTSVRWRNPHPFYTVTVENENGKMIDWEIETGSAEPLTRWWPAAN